jgi:hypothetical protein
MPLLDKPAQMQITLPARDSLPRTRDEQTKYLELFAVAACVPVLFSAVLG